MDNPVDYYDRVPHVRKAAPAASGARVQVCEVDAGARAGHLAAGGADLGAWLDTAATYALAAFALATTWVFGVVAGLGFTAGWAMPPLLERAVGAIEAAMLAPSALVAWNGFWQVLLH